MAELVLNRVPPWQSDYLCSLLRLLEIIEVSRYFRAEADGGAGAPRNCGQDFPCRVHDDHLVGTLVGLAIETQLQIDTGLYDVDNNPVRIVDEKEERREKLAVAHTQPKPVPLSVVTIQGRKHHIAVRM